MSAIWQSPLTFGLIAACFTGLGLLAVALNPNWSARRANMISVGAAGLLLTVACLHIIPEALHLVEDAWLMIGLGFGAAALLHFGLNGFPFRSGAKNELAGVETKNLLVIVTPLLAIATHSFLDGLVYSVTFAASWSAGLFVAISLILHEVPEGIIAYTLVRQSGASTRKSFAIAFLVAACTTPLGVLVSQPVMAMLAPEMIGALFAGCAGLLLFVALVPLLMPIREIGLQKGPAVFGAGALAAVGILLVPIPGHDHNHIGSAHAEHIDFTQLKHGHSRD